MSVIAKWGSKTLEVTASKLYSLSNFSTSFNLNIERDKDDNGEPVTRIDGLQPIKLSFDVFLSDSTGINVKGEIDSWKSLVGKSEVFHLGATAFLSQKFLLTGVDLSDAVIDNNGRIRSTKIGLSFDEHTADMDKRPPNPLGNPTPIQNGSRVKVIGTHYATGETVPQWVKNNAHVVGQMKPDRALLGYPDGIRSWVLLKDLTLA